MFNTYLTALPNEYGTRHLNKKNIVTREIDLPINLIVLSSVNIN